MRCIALLSSRMPTDSLRPWAAFAYSAFSRVTTTRAVTSRDAARRSTLDASANGQCPVSRAYTGQSLGTPRLAGEFYIPRSARGVFLVVVCRALVGQCFPGRRPAQIPILLGVADQPLAVVALQRLLLLLLLLVFPFHRFLPGVRTD